MDLDADHWSLELVLVTCPCRGHVVVLVLDMGMKASRETRKYPVFLISQPHPDFSAVMELGLHLSFKFRALCSGLEHAEWTNLI